MKQLQRPSTKHMHRCYYKKLTFLHQWFILPSRWRWECECTVTCRVVPLQRTPQVPLRKVTKVSVPKVSAMNDDGAASSSLVLSLPACNKWIGAKWPGPCIMSILIAYEQQLCKRISLAILIFWWRNWCWCPFPLILFSRWCWCPFLLILFSRWC